MQCVFRYLAEGILPTTNEISVLKYLEEGEQEFTQNSDGFFIRRLPAKLLQEMNVVDTPGTNVILDRQQRLTEEYVPRADLVLFVMSADRPFTESEVNFLKYIRQWGKKVIFLVNKVSATACSCIHHALKFASTPQTTFCAQIQPNLSNCKCIYHSRLVRHLSFAGLIL